MGCNPDFGPVLLSFGFSGACGWRGGSEAGVSLALGAPSGLLESCFGL